MLCCCQSLDFIAFIQIFSPHSTSVRLFALPHQFTEFWWDRTSDTGLQDGLFHFGGRKDWRFTESNQQSAAQLRRRAVRGRLGSPVGSLRCVGDLGRWGLRLHDQREAFCIRCPVRGLLSLSGGSELSPWTAEHSSVKDEWLCAGKKESAFDVVWFDFCDCETKSRLWQNAGESALLLLLQSLFGGLLCRN